MLIALATFFPGRSFALDVSPAATPSGPVWAGVKLERATIPDLQASSRRSGACRARARSRSARKTPQNRRRQTGWPGKIVSWQSWPQSPLAVTRTVANAPRRRRVALACPMSRSPRLAGSTEAGSGGRRSSFARVTRRRRSRIGGSGEKRHRARMLTALAGPVSSAAAKRRASSTFRSSRPLSPEFSTTSCRVLEPFSSSSRIAKRFVPDRFCARRYPLVLVCWCGQKAASVWGRVGETTSTPGGVL
jgi:hypothetical protein